MSYDSSIRTKSNHSHVLWKLSEIKIRSIHQHYQIAVGDQSHIWNLILMQVQRTRKNNVYVICRMSFVSLVSFLVEFIILVIQPTKYV